MHPLQVVTAKVVSMGVSGENSSQESSSDSSPGSPSHHHHQQQQQQQQHHHHPVVGPNHEAENLLPSVVNACVFVCLCVGVCVFVHMCTTITVFLNCMYFVPGCLSPDLQVLFLVSTTSVSENFMLSPPSTCSMFLCCVLPLFSTIFFPFRLCQVMRSTWTCYCH